MRVLVFTGHRLDVPGRKTPRFPAASEELARQMIADAIDAERLSTEDRIIAIAGGASGGDILFHELCAERGIPSEMLIVDSRDAYVAASVQDAGQEWVRRFDALADKLPVRVLGDSSDSLSQARSPRGAKDHSIWARSNRWMLDSALGYDAKNVTLIALWDGAAGDGPGGTKNMVDTAHERGAKVVVLDAKRLASAHKS